MTFRAAEHYKPELEPEIHMPTMRDIPELQRNEGMGCGEGRDGCELPSEMPVKLCKIHLVLL